jgi:hypothetical protein
MVVALHAGVVVDAMMMSPRLTVSWKLQVSGLVEFVLSTFLSAHSSTVGFKS